MKNIFLLLLISLLSISVFSQTPQSFSYQAVVRDASGNVLQSVNVSFKLSVILGPLPGTVEYVETHTATTNTFGIVTLAVGSGTPFANLFSDVDWSTSPQFLKVEADLGGGYINMGTTQLLSVPYALYAEQAGNVQTYTAGNGMTLTGNTFIAQTTSALWNANQLQSISVSSTAPTINQVLKYDGTNWSPDVDLNTGTPGGLNKTVQFNNSGSFGGDTAMIWDNTNKRLGVGITNPTGRMVVQGSLTASDTLPLFEVKNKTGQTIFVVYPDSVHVYVKDNGAKSNQGGFAVSGRNSSKAMTNDFLRVTPDSTRIWTGDSLKGFGVKNIGPTSKTSYTQLTPDNYFIGHQAGKSITSGKYNSFIGYQAGFLDTSGHKNYFIGYRSGYNNLSGYSNIFIGDSAGFSNTTGYKNVFIGNLSGFSNLAGNYNVFLGFYTGYTNTASYNVFLGYESGKSNTTGTRNAFMGYRSGKSNTTGTNNVFIGDSTGCDNITGNNNTAIGGWSLCNNQTGTFNTAYGFTSMHDNTTGGENTAIGTYSLYSNTTGYSNTAVGYIALGYCVSGNNNTAVGHQALNVSSAGNYNTAIGSTALKYSTTGGYNTAIGHSTLEANTTGTYNTALGYNALITGTTYTNSTALGANSAITVSNKVRIGNATVTVIEGQVAYTFPSDGRFKNNVNEEVKGLDFINRLRPIVYNFDTKKFDAFLMKDLPDSTREEILKNTDYNESSSIRQSGFIAQEVEQAAKESGYNFNGVHKPASNKDNYSVAYSLFTVPLVKAVQELNTVNLDLQKTINIQNKKINDLQTQINDLKKIILNK